MDDIFEEEDYLSLFNTNKYDDSEETKQGVISESTDGSSTNESFVKSIVNGIKHKM